MGSEKNFENRVKKYLESVGVYALGTPTDKMPIPSVGYFEKRWGCIKSGLPDLHICINGKSIEVELKKETGTPKQLQLFMINQMNAAGGKAILLYPKDFEHFKDLIEGYL